MGTGQSCRHFTCGLCGKLVRICRRCDRGNIYCGEVCRESARRQSNRRRSARYQKSEVGRRNHRRRQDRYRSSRETRSDSSAQTTTIKVTHHGSADREPPVPRSPDLPEVSVTTFDRLHLRVAVPSRGSYRCRMCHRQVSERVRTTFLSGRDPG